MEEYAINKHTFYESGRSSKITFSGCALIAQTTADMLLPDPLPADDTDTEGPTDDTDTEGPVISNKS